MTLHTVETAVEAIKAEIPRKQRIYETQEFSQHDVKQINAERQNLCRQITQLENESETVDKDFWSEEMALGKGRDAVSSHFLCTHHPICIREPICAFRIWIRCGDVFCKFSPYHQTL